MRDGLGGSSIVSGEHHHAQALRHQVTHGFRKAMLEGISSAKPAGKFAVDRDINYGLSRTQPVLRRIGNRNIFVAYELLVADCDVLAFDDAADTFAGIGPEFHHIG